MSKLYNKQKCLHDKKSNRMPASRSHDHKRGATEESEGGEIESFVGLWKRKRRKMDSSTPARTHRNEMMVDPDLMPPLHPMADTADGESSNNNSDGGDPMAGTDRTNLSENL